MICWLTEFYTTYKNVKELLDQLFPMLILRGGTSLLVYVVDRRFRLCGTAVYT